MRIAVGCAVLVVLTCAAAAATYTPPRAPGELPDWRFVAVVSLGGMLLLWVVVPLALGRGVGAVFRMRCPRCGGGVSWLGSGWRPPFRWRRLTVCLYCNAFLRTEKTENGWKEIDRKS